MTNYKPYINALRQCAEEHENDITPFSHIIVSDLCKDTANLLEELELEKEPRKGHWILTDDNFVYCSQCEDRYYSRPIDASWYFCPHCGADMREGEE